MNMDTLMRTCIKMEASDIHVRVGRRPSVRIHGRIRDLDSAQLGPEETTRCVDEILPDRLREELEETGTADFAVSHEAGGRFRVSAFREKGGLGLALRLIPTRLLGFEELGLGDNVRDLLTRPRGLVLVTGPTGSGKTTTLATMIDEVNRTQDKHIVTIEDPIEFVHEHKKSIVTQREVGSDTTGFTEAMRRVLRQDPDVILLGEMRDYETISTAITAAETGHLVLATLHTTGSARTVDRIIDSFPTDQQEQVRTQLALSLVAVVSQILVPRKEGGLTAVFEVMINTSGVENHIRKGETFKITSDIQTGRKHGMVLLDDYLLDLYRRGVIAPETAVEYAQDRNEMRTRLA